MKTDELDFPLPEELIALHPAPERSASRLMAMRCASGAMQHLAFRDLPGLLGPGDLLVTNDTRVVPARFLAQKPSGGRVEGLWLEAREDGRALCMLSGGRLRPGTELLLTNGSYRLRLADKVGPGRWLLEDAGGLGWLRLLSEFGEIPLPPYIRSRRLESGEPETAPDDSRRYQALWAREDGAVAAPTASLHFDDAVRAALDARGVAWAALTLHVGAGTFLPVTSERLEEHRLEGERYRVPAATLAALHAARARGSRVVAVGTTVCRVLEHLALAGRGPESGRPVADAEGVTELFIRPGFDFRWTDALLTNFHTPRSTLLALVAAFAQAAGAADGLAHVKAAYAQAVALRYRFYSYGDATFWTP